MKKEKPTTKICKHCKTEIPYAAKICPQCRKKQGKGLVAKIVIVIIVLIVLGSLFGSDDESDSTSNQDVATEEKIEYTKCSVKDMMDLLDTNAAKAAKEYKDKYIEITGELSVIDSDLAYIDITGGDEWDIIGVTCYIMNEEQEEQILEMEVGDEITVQGKCTDVGEVLGYYLDIDNIK